MPNVQRFILVFGTFLLSVLLYIDRVCISAAKEPIAEDLGLSDTQMGWVLSAFALGYALCQAPAGILADRFGPRRILTAVVVFWSVFTGLTAAAFNLVSMLAARLLFGAGEAGAFPGIARATYSWIPMQERGLVQGINFSGSRLGAAFALPVMALAIDQWGWRTSFTVLMGIGFLWAIFWWIWFCDDPVNHTSISEEELNYILDNRQSKTEGHSAPQLTVGDLIGSATVWKLSAQYFCSNFTFFFCLTWLFPHLKATYELTSLQAGVYSAAPFIGGAIGNWVSGWWIDKIYLDGAWVQSRRIPAVTGYALAVVGVVASVYADTALTSIIWFTIAIFGADMTLSPSWSACIDIGQQHAGLVSGTMNMAGNIGSFMTGLAFPMLADWTGSYTPFFFVAAGLNVGAIILWMLIDPRHPVRSSAAQPVSPVDEATSRDRAGLDTESDHGEDT